jgi:hypothetical protein
MRATVVSNRHPGRAAGVVALALTAAITLAGCSSPVRPTASVGYLDAPFTHRLTFGTLTIEPAAIGEQPLVPVTAARYVAQHPQTWLGGAPRNDLVAFGYGRVSAPTDTVVGRVPFRTGRLAWIAVYRSSAAHLFISSCLAGPDHRTGWHLVAGAPKPDHFYIAVLIDATTGAQATSIPIFHDVCEHLVRNS